ncbi:MAG TPA: tetratricopeptide repeat protein [Thermoanaerobaculia bacterium]|nr:tetratricopeptide repeat protein [Thermoanaerobaculia bacterium]
MTEPTEWAPALAILIGGLVLGALFIVYMRGRKSRPLAELNELEAERDALLGQLRSLDANAAEERARLERAAADVLRRLDQRGRPEVAPPVAAAPQGNPALRGFLWGAGSFAALALLAYFVMKSSTPRTDAPAAPMATAQPAPQQNDRQLQVMEARVQGAPDDLDARVALAKAYLERDNLMAVFEQTQYVLGKNPAEPRALTYQALVRLAMGETDNALKMLETATQKDPALLDAWVALAWVHVQGGRMADAEKDIASAKQQHPEDAQRLDQVFAQMKLQVAQKSQQELPPNHPPVEAPPTTGAHVTVALELDPSVAKTGVVYVIIRATGVQGGPPVAVKRLAVAQLPTTIEMSQADSMMGQPLPAQMRVEARLDSDGDAATRNPADPFAAQDAVAPGASIRLALK